MFDTYSNRQKKTERAGEPDVYQYDTLPPEFRNQAAWILGRAIGPYFDRSGNMQSGLEEQRGAVFVNLSGEQPLSNQVWDYIANTIEEEAGSPAIGEKYRNAYERCVYRLSSADTNSILDVIDLAFHVVDTFLRHQPEGKRRLASITCDADQAIHLLNLRFRQHGIG